MTSCRLSYSSSGRLPCNSCTTCIRFCPAQVLSDYSLVDPVQVEVTPRYTSAYVRHTLGDKRNNHGHTFLFLLPSSTTCVTPLTPHHIFFHYLYSLSYLMAIHFWAWRLCCDSILLYWLPSSTHQGLMLYTWLLPPHSLPWLQMTHAVYLCTI